MVQHFKQLFLCMCILSAVVVLVFLILKNQTATSTTVDSLSPRAQEFIANQRQSGSGFWNYQQLASPTSNQNSSDSSEIVTECFKLTFPWKYTNQTSETTETRCTWRAKSIHPLSYVVISTYQIADIELDSGVILRRQERKNYVESHLTTNHFSRILVFRSNGALIAFAQLGSRGLTLALNNLSPSVIISDSDIQNIFDSITTEPIPQ